MPPDPQPAPTLTGLFRPDAMQEANSEIWPSMGSFQWWLRKHRAALLEAGALIEINGKLYVYGELALKVVVTEGRKQAASRTNDEEGNDDAA